MAGSQSYHQGKGQRTLRPSAESHGCFLSEMLWSLVRGRTWGQADLSLLLLPSQLCDAAPPLVWVPSFHSGSPRACAACVGVGPHLDMLLVQGSGVIFSQAEQGLHSWCLANQDTESSLGLPRSHDRHKSSGGSQPSVPDHTPKENAGGSVGTGMGCVGDGGGLC